MKLHPLAALFCAVCISAGAEAVAPGATNTTVLLVLGAPGAKEYEQVFARQAEAWERAASRGGFPLVRIGPVPGGQDQTAPATAMATNTVAHSETNDLAALKQALAAQPTTGPAPLWLVLSGHGTFDGKEAWFNLRGPDLSSKQLSEWLRPFQRPLAVVNTAPSSAPFLNALSATNRLIITATRSGHEQYHTRFGEYFAEALTNSASDLDKDDQVSLLEAFLVASRQTGEFYKVNGRIATEHALLDDNGDGMGTPADWFKGLRPAKKATDKAQLDGLLAQQFHLIPGDADRELSAEQVALRDRLVRQVLDLRERKASLEEDKYYQQLEELLLQLARIYGSSKS